MSLIKICGVRNVEFAISVAEAGVDYLGLNFVKASRRRVELSMAAEIIRAVRDYPVKMVAVVCDQSACQIEDLCSNLGIFLVQLHGLQSQQALPFLSSELQKIVVVPVQPTGEFQVDISNLRPDQDLLLFDAQNPGSGQTYNLKNISSVNFPCLLAGGIHSKNAIQRLSQSGAVGVDLASGIETEGIPSIQRALDFISTIKRAHHVSN